MADQLYRRVDGTTNYRQVDPRTVPSRDWVENGISGGALLVWLSGSPESFRCELSGPEVNELAGRVVVEPPLDAESLKGGAR